MLCEIAYKSLLSASQLIQRVNRFSTMKTFFSSFLFNVRQQKESCVLYSCFTCMLYVHFINSKLSRVENKRKT